MVKDQIDTKEILKKEEEKYKSRLQFIGLLTNWEQVAQRALTTFSVTNESVFYEQKMALLLYFYGKILKYPTFVNQQKVLPNERLQQDLQRYASLYIDKRYESRPQDTLDNDLKTGPHLTIAYHKAKSVFNHFYQVFFATTTPFLYPAQLDRFFAQQIEEAYPLSFDVYLDYLRKEDPSFWDITCRYAAQITAVSGQKYLSKESHNNIVLGEVYQALKKEIADQGKVIYNGAKGFRNHIIAISNNKAISYYSHINQINPNSKKAKFPQMHLPTDSEGNAIYDSETFAVSPENDSAAHWEKDVEQIRSHHHIKELNIDISNPLLVSNAISIILQNQQHPLRKALLTGLNEYQEKVWMGRIFHEKSYEDIVKEIFGQQLDDKDLKREVNNAAQTFRRLCKRDWPERLLQAMTRTKKKNHEHHCFSTPLEIY